MLAPMLLACSWSSSARVIPTVKQQHDVLLRQRRLARHVDAQVVGVAVGVERDAPQRAAARRPGRRGRGPARGPGARGGRPALVSVYRRYSVTAVMSTLGAMRVGSSKRMQPWRTSKSLDWKWNRPPGSVLSAPRRPEALVGPRDVERARVDRELHLDEVVLDDERRRATARARRRRRRRAPGRTTRPPCASRASPSDAEVGRERDRARVARTTRSSRRP